MYPAAVIMGLVALVIALLIWKRVSQQPDPIMQPRQIESLDDQLESNTKDRTGLLHVLAFVAVAALIGERTGLRFILFPPLIVMAYEILGHPEVPGWVKRPFLFPLFCFLTASVGLVMLRLMGQSTLSVAVTVAISILLLRVFQVRMPPALAIGLLPFVIRDPNWWFPLSVLIGTAILSLWFIARGKWLGRAAQIPAASSK
ncbi:HPP family protein [Silvibacterium acidisoli]|uniref:HPP family protein n=1 Tax=Acidobacteriaceae bacterium ZG23-2 TaxID=2883246 RepID=UPI00406C59D1